MKFRVFELVEDVDQLGYRKFRTAVEENRPAVWSSIEELPIEIFYDVLVRSAIQAGWVSDVVEENEYEEETTWVWNEDYLDGLPPGKFPLREWGQVVFDRWVEYKSLDPN